LRFSQRPEGITFLNSLPSSLLRARHGIPAGRACHKG
jgi:hypothetical protein